MIEIGAGGGSIAGIDEVGLLRVGPRSAGADPGPACYGRGGEEATVTDANLVLGYYDPAFFLGGRMSLDRKAAMTAVGKLGDEIGLSAIEAAHGIHKVVTESMAAAARIHLVEKGKDPRAYTMVGFGGAGPAHAAGVARTLGIREVIIPPASGTASCLGFLVAPLSFERVRSYPLRIAPGYDAAALNAILGTLEDEGRALLAEAGITGAQVTVERSADMRLVGQMHEINVPLPAGAISEVSLGAIRASFADVYTKRLHRVLRRGRDRGDQLSRTRGRPRAGALAAADGRGRAAEAEGIAPGLVRVTASSRPSSMTAMRSCPATRSPALRSSRSARRRPSCRRATCCGSTTISTCASRSASRPRRARWSRPA